MAQNVCGRAAWRSLGHLTTYGPTDNPTFITTFPPFQIDETETKNQKPVTLYCNCSITE